MVPPVSVVSVRGGTLVRDDGTTIAFDVAGAGPPVVFVHGLTSQRHSWDPVTDRLTSDFTCVRLDLRGHGDSSAGPDYATLALVGDVRAVVDELGLGEPAVVGHSLGATVAAVYAAVHAPPAMVCVDSSLRFGDFAALVQARTETLRSERATEALLEIERELQLGPYEGIADLERRVRAFPPEILRGIWEAALTTPPAQLNVVAETVLSQVGAPLLSLHGSAPPGSYEVWLTGLLPSAQVEVWEGTGHMLHLVEPDRFAARLRAFLSAPA